PSVGPGPVRPYRAGPRVRGTGGGSPACGAAGPRTGEQVDDGHRADHGEEPVDIHRRPPLDLAVADHEGAGRPGVQPEPAALTLLAGLIVTASAATAAGDDRASDDRHAVLLVWIGKDPPHGDRVPCGVQQLFQLHRRPPDRLSLQHPRPAACPPPVPPTPSGPLPPIMNPGS